MMPKTNVRIAALLVVLLASVLFVLKIYIGNYQRHDIKQNMVPKSLFRSLHTYRLKSQAGKPSVVPSIRREQASMKARQADLKKPTKPLMKQFELRWRKKGHVFYREIIPAAEMPKLDVLLLHGMHFTSAQWVNLTTMDILASAGYRVIAMDLPGFGKSTYKHDKKSDANLGKFLGKFIERAGLKSPVIVSPSASGRYSLAYLVRLNKETKKKVSGFVAIAVVASDRFPKKEFRHLNTVPILIMRGSKDMGLGETSMKTLHDFLPQSTVKVIRNAGHACYLDKPNEFHKTLLEFLNKIVKNQPLKV